jgi:hypothetical protein
VPPPGNFLIACTVLVSFFAFKQQVAEADENYDDYPHDHEILVIK